MQNQQLFGLADIQHPEHTTSVAVKEDGNFGLGIYIAGCSTKTASDDDPDCPVYLEIDDGHPVLRVYADINSEEPTHTIDLSGAFMSRRLTTFKGTLYYVDDEKVKHVLVTFEEQAENAPALEKAMLDKHWDDRLDSASCAPHFEYEIVC